MVTFRLRDGTGSIRLRYLVEDTDRHGNVRIYVRRPGQPKVRLHEKPGTDAFMTEYRAAIEGRTKISKPKAVSARSGTFRWLCQQWFASGEYRQLSEKTQIVRRNMLENLCRKTDRQGHPLGDKPYAMMENRHVRALRDERADTPEGANNLLKAVRTLFNWAISAKLIDRNPARDIPKLAPKNPDGHHTWTPAEIRQYEETHPIGSKARLAMALMLYTGQRISDIVLMGQQHTRDGWLRLTQQKNKGRRPVTLELPILPALAAIIEATPSARSHLTFLTTQFDRPFTVDGFGNRFRKWCDEAGLQHCSAHGLRKAMAVALAESGAAESEIMAWTGHSTSQEVTRYTKAARQKVLASSGGQKLLEQKMDKIVPPKPAIGLGGTKKVK